MNFDKSETSRPEVAAALRELEDRNGRLTPEIVFEAAKEKAHALHKFFDWNKASAAEKYNLIVARDLIRTVVYTRVIDDHGAVIPRSAPAYVRDPAASPAEQGYIALRKIIANSPSARQIMLAEIARVEAHLARALAVAEAIGFADQVNDVIERVVKLKAQVEREPEPA
jgi:hypothetical protein